MTTKRTGIGGSLIIRNGEAYGYNWREAVLSLLPICDRFVILEAYSDLDDTYEQCVDFIKGYPQISVIRDKWVGDDEVEGHEYTRLARLTNRCLHEVREWGLPWFAYVQADEAFHEDGFEQILRITSGRSRFADKPMAIMQPYRHFVANFSTTFPFVYNSSVRIARADSSWYVHKDAWIMQAAKKEDDFMVVANNAYIHHYGFVGDLEKKVRKELALQNLFISHGFPDPRVVAMAEGREPTSMAYLFQAAKEKGEFTPFTGTHPAVMRDWIEAHRGYEEEFE